MKEEGNQILISARESGGSFVVGDGGSDWHSFVVTLKKGVESNHRLLLVLPVTRPGLINR